MEYTVRLNKYLANLGVCARREVEQLLTRKSVTVNGERIVEPGFRVNPKKDVILLNGKKLMPPKHVYFLLNKPKGIISTADDEFGRKNVTSFIHTKERIYPVGRLDKDSKGLIILTNDGNLTNILTHPRYEVHKVYQLLIDGFISTHQIRAFQQGIELEDGKTAPARIKVIEEKKASSVLEVTIHEGRNRQIRRMCETVGIKLMELTRIKFGPVSIGNLKEGKFRNLTQFEIQSLRRAALKK